VVPLNLAKGEKDRRKIGIFRGAEVGILREGEKKKHQGEHQWHPKKHRQRLSGLQSFRKDACSEVWGKEREKDGEEESSRSKKSERKFDGRTMVELFYRKRSMRTNLGEKKKKKYGCTYQSANLKRC